MPKGDEVFLNFHGMVIGDLMINDTKVGEKEDYMWHRIRLNSEVGEKDILAKGWNTV